MKPVAEAVVEHFAHFNPSPDDRRNVVALIAELLQHPEIGTLIPFHQKKYKDCYVALTQDGKWRVVYRPVNPQGILVVSVDPQER